MAKKKKRALADEFLEWVAEYNIWRQQFGYPILLASSGTQGLYFAAKTSAELHQIEWPTWDELSLGAKYGPVGSGLDCGPHTNPVWLLLPKGGKGESHLSYKNIFKMAGWGQKAKPTSETANIKEYRG